MHNQNVCFLPVFDSDGYTIDPAHWTDDSTRWTANQDGLAELNPEQWDIIHAIHSLYERTGAWPGVHRLCHHLHTDKRHLESLFGDPHEAYRLAGLPNQGEEARSYL